MTDEIPSRFPQQSRSLFGFMERRQSPRSSGEHPVCETCQHTVEPFLVNRCHGCNQYAHRECRETMSIGVTWRVEMCISCTSYVRQLLRIVRATEARRFRGWDEYLWFGSVIRACHNFGTMPETDYRALNAVQTYIKDGVANGLHIWQSHSLASPTERGDPSPRGSVVVRGNSPSPIGKLLPAPPPQPMSQGLPMPKAVSEGASAEQGERFFLEVQVRFLHRGRDQGNGVKFQQVREQGEMEKLTSLQRLGVMRR